MMNFKNIFGILAISAVSMMTVSCSEDIMDRINKDEAHPGESVVSAKFQLTDAIVSSVFTTNTGNFAWYVASYTEQILGTGNNQLKNAELRSINETAAASTFDNEWNGTYLNLNNIQQMIAKCEEGGNSAGQLDIKAMGQILAAYDWGIMTDLCLVTFLALRLSRYLLLSSILRKIFTSTFWNCWMLQRVTWIRLLPAI